MADPHSHIDTKMIERVVDLLDRLHGDEPPEGPNRSDEAAMNSNELSSTSENYLQVEISVGPLPEDVERVDDEQIMQFSQALADVAYGPLVPHRRDSMMSAAIRPGIELGYGFNDLTGPDLRAVLVLQEIQHRFGFSCDQMRAAIDTLDEVDPAPR